MFGTLRPGLCHLSKEQGQAYRRMYCGTCKALGDHYGQLARPLLSYDIVLFASVIEALQEQPSATGSCRCPLLPIVHRPTLTPDSVSMRVAAAVQVMLADQWLVDQIQDGSRVVGMLRPALGMSERARTATRDLQAFGFDVAAFTSLATRQQDIERQERDIDRAAEPTAAVLESLFGQLPGLAGLDRPDDRGTDLAASLAGLGREVGTAIYALDAIEDLEGDLTAGRFNPCLDTNGRLSPKRLERVGDVLETALQAMVARVATISWRRHGDIVANVLCQQFYGRCQRALATARERAVAWQDAPPRRRIWPVRAILALVGVLAGMWSFAERRVRVLSRRRRATASACAVHGDGTHVCQPAPTMVPAGAPAVYLSTGPGGADDTGGADGSGGSAPGLLPGASPTGSEHGANVPVGVPLELASPEEQKPRRRESRRKQKKRESGKQSWWDDIFCCDVCCDICVCDATMCAVGGESGSCCIGGCGSAGCCEGVCGDGSCCDCGDCCDCGSCCDCAP